MCPSECRSLCLVVLYRALPLNRIWSGHKPDGHPTGRSWKSWEWSNQDMLDYLLLLSIPRSNPDACGSTRWVMSPCSFLFCGWEMVGSASLSPAQSKECPFRTAMPKLSATVFPSRNLTEAGITAMVLQLETFQTQIWPDRWFVDNEVSMFFK